VRLQLLNDEFSTLPREKYHETSTNGDDDEALRKLVRIRLSIPTKSLIPAIQNKRWAPLEYKPDAILLDLMMPQFNGFELAKAFKSLSYTF